MKKQFFIETFGCQMNVNDSEKVAGLLVEDGYEQAPCVEAADFVFINTCAVREKAAEKLYSAVGRLRRLKARKPQLRIGVGGCVAQLEGEAILNRARSVDLLVGPRSFERIPEMLRAQDTPPDLDVVETGRGPRGPRVARSGASVDLGRSADPFHISPAVVAHSNPVRAYVTVMEGCNHVCSFCVVPRTRGTEICRDPESIVAEVESLVARGVPEVMLLGQTVNAYRHGADDFAALLARLDAVPGLRRLRFTTSHPEHVGSPLARAMRDLSRVCPHLHLPVQSGSDRILASMRRGYSGEGYLATVAMLRTHVPHLSLTSDVIVGYPGESEADFEATLSLVEEVGFDGLFVFTYSPRPGTTAIRLEDDVLEPEKLRRLEALNQFQQLAQGARNRSRIGTREDVLIDTCEAPDHASGRTPDFRIVHFREPGLQVGQFVSAEITAAGRNSLLGRVVLAPTDSLTESSAVPIL